MAQWLRRSPTSPRPCVHPVGSSRLVGRAALRCSGEFAANCTSCLPVQIPSGGAGPSSMSRWSEPRDATTGFDSPRVLMDDVVVTRAQQHPVVDAGRATLRPRCQVVCLAPAGRNEAVREGTPLVPGNERPPEVGREKALRTSEVEHLPVAAQDQRHDVRITGEPPDVPCTDLSGEDGVAGPLGLAHQVLVVDRYHHLRTMPTRCGQAAGRQGDPAGRDQTVEELLRPGRTAVTDRRLLRRGCCSEC